MRTVGVTLVVLMWALTACGGSSGPTRAEFVKRADAVCVKAAQQRATVKAGDPAGLIEVFVVQQRAKIAGMKALSPPSELRAAYAEYRRLMARRLELMTQFLAAVRAHRSPHEFVSPAAGVRAQEDEVAHLLGLSACEEGAPARS